MKYHHRRVKIVARNPAEGQRIKGQDVQVEVDGKPLHNVRSIKWEAASRDDYAVCHVVLHDVELDFDFEMEERGLEDEI